MRDLNDEGGIFGRLDVRGKAIAREPGIVVTYAVAEDDAFSALFKIEIWGQLTMVVVIDNEERRSPGPSRVDDSQ